MREATAIRQWMTQDFGIDCPTSWVRAMAATVRAQSDQEFPPVNLGKILCLRKISHKYVKDLDVEARLVSRQTGFQILLHDRLRWYELRKRFTLAHEVGHTLFYDVKSQPPTRKIPLGLNNEFEEHICNTFAAELLIPFGYVSRVVENFGEKTEAEKVVLLDRIAFECQVARQVAARHLVHNLGVWRSILIFVAMIGKHGPTDKKDPAWRVRWSLYPSELAKSLYIPRGSGITRRAFPKLRLPADEVERMEDCAGKGGEGLGISSKAFKIGNLAGVLTRIWGDQTQVWVLPCNPLTTEKQSEPKPLVAPRKSGGILLAIPTV